MLTITRELQIELHRFNAGVQRARREYAWHEFTWSCGSFCKCPMRVRR